jgi:methionyl aminopeptidase
VPTPASTSDVVFRERGVEIKTPEQIALMREAGLVVGEALELMRAAVAPGVTTQQLDAIAAAHIRSRGAKPNFLNYHGFPATICASVNDEVVHGIPGGRVLHEGDVVSLDCGAIVQGWHGDAAITVGVGTVSDELTELMRVCEESMWRGFAAAKLGGRVTDISHAIESYVRSQGDYGVVEDYVGHGIGSAMHMPPSVPNYGRPGKGPKLVRGLALAVEPMITLGTIETRTLEDDWTVVTTDGSRAAHFEHSFTLTPDGALILTALDGGKAKLAELGVPCAA